MSSNKPVLGLVGSPNKNGRTYQLVSAALACAGVAAGRRADIDGDLGHADILAASGRELDAAVEATRVYESSVKVFDEK